MDTILSVFHHLLDCSEIEVIYFHISSLSVKIDTHIHNAFLAMWVSVMISEQEGSLPW